MAEDDSAVREVVTRMLTRANYRVIAAPTAEDALEILTSTQAHVDALLTDVVMPGMSGPQLAERIKGTATHHQLPVLLMSGYPAGSFSSGPAAVNDLPLIRKPFDTATLLEHLHEILP